MMRLVFCVSAISTLARATRAKSNDFAWPWDQDSHHARPVHLRSNMMATHSRTSVHDLGSSFDSSSFGEDASESSGDFMDKYISETGEKPLQITSDDRKPQPQQDAVPDMASIFGDENVASKPAPRSFDSNTHSSDTYNFFGGDSAAPKPAPQSFDSDSHSSSDTAGFAADMTNLFGGSNFGSSPAPARTSKSDDSSDTNSGWPWSGHNKRRSDMDSRSRGLWDTDATNTGSGSDSSGDRSSISNNIASDSFSKMFSSWSSNDVSGSAGQDANPKPAAQSQTSMDSLPSDTPIEGPPQRVSSLSGASATDQVVDVRLSSELQQSLLQARKAETKMFSHFRGA